MQDKEVQDQIEWRKWKIWSSHLSKEPCQSYFTHMNLSNGMYAAKNLKHLQHLYRNAYHLFKYNQSKKKGQQAIDALEQYVKELKNSLLNLGLLQVENQAISMQAQTPEMLMREREQIGEIKDMDFEMYFNRRLGIYCDKISTKGFIICSFLTNFSEKAFEIYNKKIRQNIEPAQQDLVSLSNTAEKLFPTVLLILKDINLLIKNVFSFIEQYSKKNKRLIPSLQWRFVAEMRLDKKLYPQQLRHLNFGQYILELSKWNYVIEQTRDIENICLQAERSLGIFEKMKEFGYTNIRSEGETAREYFYSTLLQTEQRLQKYEYMSGRRRSKDNCVWSYSRLA